MEMKNNKLIVVLGMHRSGTSAITRGLQVMGVQLGERLTPAIAGDNAKGFWEDIDLNALNMEMLSTVDSDWYHLSAINAIDVGNLRKQGYFLRAIELLRQRVGTAPVFGFKDPRVAKLLPFWKEVFSHCQFDVSYLLAVRNPLSVVKSLAKRNGIETELSYLLWLGHVITSLTGSAGDKRVLVDYDRLMHSPDRELMRVAKYTGLEIDPIELQSYKNTFLDQGLRHTVYELHDLLADDTCPPIVCEVYAALLDVASEKTKLDDLELQNKVMRWSNEFERLSSPLLLVDKILAQKEAANQAISDGESKRSFLEETISDRDRRLSILEEEISYRNRRISDLEDAISDRDRIFSSLEEAASCRDRRLSILKEDVFNRDSQITALNQIVGECDEQIAKLNQLATMLNAHIVSMVFSKSFYVTKPLRFFGRMMRGELKTAMAPFMSKRANNPVTAVCQIKEDIESLSTTILTHKEKFAVSALQTATIPLTESVQTVSEVVDSKTEIPWIEFDQTRNQFVEYQNNPPIHPLVKLIAFYLPQFHPFPENDEWWGKGFTEWTNVGKARPNYFGHYQPHCPIHHGYYDLRVPDVMEEQARLAKEYGIHGFSYYFYWFDGKILMDSPLESMLTNKKVDIPFCLTWANENWSRRWDGKEEDLLISQNHSKEDSLAFIRHLVKYFKDERYIRIDGKPILIIYRADIIPNMAATAKIWRDEMVRHGIPGLYLMSAQTFGILSPEEFDFDASVEFPPHIVHSSLIDKELELVNPDFNGHIFSYDQMASYAVLSQEPDYKLYRTPMLSWDNTARKQNNSNIFHGFSLLRYKQWLSSIVNKVHSNQKYSADEKIVFVNAWNEWAEGTHLEPDQKFGYGYLQTTYDVLRDYDSLLSPKLRNTHSPVKKSDYAVILHLDYDELWPNIRDYLVESFGDYSFDMYVSVTSSFAAQKVLEDFPDAYIELVENRGRDILPFIHMLKVIQGSGYTAVCKIHSKPSVYRDDGDNIPDDIFTALLGSKEHVEEILSRFRNNARLGLVAPKNYLVEHNDQNMIFDRDVVQRISNYLHINFQYDIFPAGSMFWFSPKSLEPLLALDDTFFEIESGLRDGTCSNAVERMFCQVVRGCNYMVESC